MLDDDLADVERRAVEPVLLGYEGNENAISHYRDAEFRGVGSENVDGARGCGSAKLDQSVVVFEFSAC